MYRDWLYNITFSVSVLLKHFVRVLFFNIHVSVHITVYAPGVVPSDRIQPPGGKEENKNGSLTVF